MARLYANENFPMPVVEELRRLGHNVLTMLEAGQTGQAMSDAEPALRGRLLRVNRPARAQR